MLTLLKKEVDSFLHSIIGYVVISVFLLGTGIFIWVIPGTDFNIPESRYAALDSLFILAPWIFLFLIPAVTMRMFAEENKSGTIELLLTRPLTELQVVMAKFSAGVLLVLISLLPTLVYYFSIFYLASPPGNVDTAGIAGSYIGLLFLCCGFVSIGVFSSVVTGNQIVSFILSMMLCLFFYSGFDFLGSLPLPIFLSNTLSAIGISVHYSSLSRGVIDSRDVVYFVSLSALFILFTRFVLEKRKW